MNITTGYVVTLIKLGFLVAALSITGCVSDAPKSANSENPAAASQQHIKLALKYIGSDNRDLARVHLEKAANTSLAFGPALSMLTLCYTRASKNLS